MISAVGASAAGCRRPLRRCCAAGLLPRVGAPRAHSDAGLSLRAARPARCCCSYWALDFYQTNQFFGTAADLRRLTRTLADNGGRAAWPRGSLLPLACCPSAAAASQLPLGCCCRSLRPITRACARLPLFDRPAADIGFILDAVLNHIGYGPGTAAPPDFDPSLQPFNPFNKTDHFHTDCSREAGGD